MCATCDPFDTEIAISGPTQLRRLIAKLQDAVRAGVLQATPAFSELNIDTTLPDVLSYDFRCQACAAEFRLRVETYHGQGGAWSKVDR